MQSSGNSQSKQKYEVGVGEPTEQQKHKQHSFLMPTELRWSSSANLQQGLLFRA